MSVLNENVRALMKLRQGKEVIWEILSRCGVFNSTYSLESERASAYLEGRRSIGLEIIDIMNDADPTIFPRLLLEYTEKELTKE